ncbi:MAG TPA: hypothetical protein VLF18_03140, partial [Tahibacter sp.]|nr:hypothetical protein [Tahibacter sp.]
VKPVLDPSVPAPVRTAPIPASAPASKAAAPTPVTPPPAAAPPAPAPVKLAVPNAVASAPIPGASRPAADAPKPAPVTGQLPLGMPEPASEPAATSVRQAVSSALRTPAAADEKPADADKSE